MAVSFYLLKTSVGVPPWEGLHTPAPNTSCCTRDLLDIEEEGPF